MVNNNYYYLALLQAKKAMETQETSIEAHIDVSTGCKAPSR